MARTVQRRARHQPALTKGSRFVATVSPIETETHARDFLGEIRAEWPDASHHCWAWRLAEPAIDRAGDDGEPGSSAGRPILAALAGRDLVNTAVVVSRWFGGTKLGVGGLVRAYGGAAAQVLDRVATETWVALSVVDFEHSLGDTAIVDRVLAGLGAVVVDTDWAALVHRRVKLRRDSVDQLWAALAESTSGRVRSPLAD